MPRRSCGIGALVLLLGLAALGMPPASTEPETWEALLAPYSTGAPLPNGFRIEEVRRGPANDVVVSIRRPDDGAAVEVVVVERGRWQSVHESRSFTIDYEVPRSPAAERDVVTKLLAETIRSRDRGLPSPAAVPLRAGDPSVLPWWLEMLRGVRGMLFGAGLVLLAMMALHRSPGVAAAGAALGVAMLVARWVGVPSWRPDVGAEWTMPAAAVLLFIALRRRGSGSRTGLPAISSVAAVALVLRLALGPWAPLHVNGHGARFVAGAVHDPGDIAAYGPGYSEIFAPVVALMPSSPDWAIFACNALLSALVPALALAIARMMGVAAGPALAAAMLLAIDPIAIRMGATEAYFVAIGFLCTAASAALLFALSEMEAGGRWRATGVVVASGLLLSQAARIHPCGWMLMATVPFVVPAGDAGSWRRRLVMSVVAAAVSGGVLLLTSASVLLDVFGNIRSGTVYRPGLPSPSPLVWVALAGALYAMLAPRRWLALPAAISVAALLMTWHGFDASWIWAQSYSRLYLTLPLLAAIACVPPLLLSRRWVALAAATVVALAWMRFGLPVIAARSTEQLEYRWVRTHLRRLPPECRIVHLAFAGKRVLTLPTYVGQGRAAVAIDLRRPPTIEAALSPAECLFYVHGSLCSTADGRPECEALERRLGMVPIARASFTGARESNTFAHEREPVETIIARVERVDGRSSR